MHWEDNQASEENEEESPLEQAKNPAPLHAKNTAKQPSHVLGGAWIYKCVFHLETEVPLKAGKEPMHVSSEWYNVHTVSAGCGLAIVSPEREAIPGSALYVRLKT
ncbi:hypothetical protein NDU88_007336 [Pleurodeles waltl]|uniref:Uncharacterized protein n=1 Tax=Pleurodeles waltl TaxID=8319 RepID=A0AAV7P1V9_PLEWA|nr:hypothetical protein NDU88_007336 [Pleurodeles waltl]